MACGNLFAAKRLQVEPVESANPYWREQGLRFADPDGFRVSWPRTRGARTTN